MIAGMNARILWIACLVTLAAVGCTADPKPNTYPNSESDT